MRKVLALVATNNAKILKVLAVAMTNEDDALALTALCDLQALSEQAGKAVIDMMPETRNDYNSAMMMQRYDALKAML